MQFFTKISAKLSSVCSSNRNISAFKIKLMQIKAILKTIIGSASHFGHRSINLSYHLPNRVPRHPGFPFHRSVPSLKLSDGIEVDY